MASSARLVTIKRSGDDGAHFPLTLSSCLFGRSIECDIRIQLPVVSKKHCKIEINDQQAILHNFSSTNPTQVNGATVDEPVQLKHGDIITIIDRSFRYENGNHEDGSRSRGFPGKSFGQEPVQQSSRASFSDPDGKGQDASTSKTTSRRSLVHAKRLSGDSSASGGSKDSITQDPSNTCSSGLVEQHSGRNTEEPTSDVLLKKSRAAGSSFRELKSSPAQSLSNSKKHESPFEKLYQSMKEELSIKSQKQSRRKSEPQPECAAGKETWETKLLVSCKSRAKSSGSIPGPAVSSPKVGKIWTEDQSSAVGPLQTSTEALSSSFLLAETAEMKTPVRNPQQLKNEESHVSVRRESVNLNESEGAKADYKIVTPRKPATRNQTPVKVEGAASPAGKPENISSKKRKSLPAKIEVLSAETQSQFSSTHHLASDEKKTPKDSFNKPEKLATAARQIYSGLPGLSSVDISNFGDSINKSEGMSLKRRRVSFGGHLRPELFDENLPPNTPLKRGETPTKRKSLAPHTPSVLKKIIKERPQSPGKQESPGITLPSPNDQRRRSGRSAPASSGSESLPQTDTPKKASRKSGNLPAKRASISRSQHDILQMISSKRRSGASEANLIVAKSWADVVKLGTKQTQTKVVKHVPQKQGSKRQRRPNTPKKPTSNLHNQFSTGHANSPCTIVIGRAQIEKVSMPARPYKMLNNLILNQKIDFSEDLSGLTEMFKTPVKEKQQQINDMGSILSNSENLPEKQFEVTNSGDKPLPFTSEILGENALSSTQNAAKEPSDKYFASPTLRRRSIKNGNTVQTPENVQNITHLEKKTPVPSVKKLGRSRELRHKLAESMNESTEADLDQGIIVRYLRKTSLQGQEVDQQVQDSEKCSQRFKESVELKEDPEETSAMRSSARKQKPAKDLIGSQMVTQTAACAEELFNQENGTTEKPEESMHKQSTPISDGQRATKQKADKVLCKTPQPTTDNTKTNTKPWHSTSGKKVDMKEEQSEQKKFVHMSGGTRHTPKVPELAHGGIKALKESENRMLDLTVTGSKKPVPGDKITKMSNKSPYPEFPELARTPASIKRLSKTGLGKGDVREELSTLGKRTKSPGRTSHTPIASELEENDTTAFVETPKQKLDFTENSTGSKRKSRKSKMRAQPLEDLDGFQELFQTPAATSDPVIVGETTKVSLESLQLEPVRTPASTKRLSKAGLGKGDEKEKLSTVGKRTKSPGRTSHTPTAPVLEENDTRALVETPKQKLDFTENSAGSKRRSRTPKMKAQPLEDLVGFQELFQTPAGTSDPVTVGETTKVSLESLQAEPVRTPASTKRLSKTGFGKVDVREQLSPLNKRMCSAQEDMHVLRLSENDVTGTKDLKESAARILNPAVSVTSSKRQQGACKKKSQFPEDLSGLQELFQTPGHDKDSLAGDKLTKMPHRSLPPEPINTSVISQRQSRTKRMKVHVKSEPSGDRMLPQMSEEIMDISRVPECEDKGIRTRKQSVKRKLDTAVSVPSSKRQRVARAEKAQTLEDLPEFQELYQTPSLAVEPVMVDKTTKMPSKSPEPVDTTSETQTGRRLRRVGVMKEPLAQRKTTRVLRETRNTYKEPVGDNKDVKEFKESSVQKQDPAVILIGRRRQPRTLKKTQPLKELPSIQEETAIRICCEFPQPEEKESSASSKRQLRIQLCKVGVKEEPTAQRKPRGRVTRNTLKEPMSDSGNVEELKESTKQKIDLVASVPVSKRPRRVPREKTQPLEVTGPIEPVQIPSHTEELASDERPTRVPCDSLQPEQADNLQTSPRRLRTRRGKIEVDQEPSVVKKTVPTSRQTTRSRKVPEIDDKDTQASKESGEQQLETVANVAGSRRQLRAHKNEVQPFEVLGDSKKLIQISEHTEKLRHETSTLKSTIQQMPDPIKPLRTSRRVLRASKEDTVETVEMSVDTRDPAESQSKSNTFLSPKKKSARGGGGPRARGLCSVTPKQEAIDEKPAPKKQRAVPSKRHLSPEPVKMKHLRIMSSKTEPVEEQISNVMKTEEEAQVENSTPPDQKMPLPSRYRKKTSEKHPRPKVGASTEKDGMKTNEKTMKSSQEAELQNTDNGAKKSTSRGKVSGKRTCLRSGGQSEIPQPRAAEEKTSETGAKILKTQKEKGVSGDLDARSLRSRKTGATLDSDPNPKITRGAKKDIKVPKKDEDIVYTTKLRTRSHKNS